MIYTPCLDSVPGIKRGASPWPTFYSENRINQLVDSGHAFGDNYDDPGPIRDGWNHAMGR